METSDIFNNLIPLLAQQDTLNLHAFRRQHQYPTCDASLTDWNKYMKTVSQFILSISFSKVFIHLETSFQKFHDLLVMQETFSLVLPTLFE